MKIAKADKLYGDLVDVIGQMSTSRRFKVGAIIVDDGLENIIAFGYNGTPRGWDNDCEIEKNLAFAMNIEQHLLSPKEGKEEVSIIDVLKRVEEKLQQGADNRFSFC